MYALFVCEQNLFGNHPNLDEQHTMLVSMKMYVAKILYHSLHCFWSESQFDLRACTNEDTEQFPIDLRSKKEGNIEIQKEMTEWKQHTKCIHVSMFKRYNWNWLVPFWYPHFVYNKNVVFYGNYHSIICMCLLVFHGFFPFTHSLCSALFRGKLIIEFMSFLTFSMFGIVLASKAFFSLIMNAQKTIHDYIAVWARTSEIVWQSHQTGWYFRRDSIWKKSESQYQLLNEKMVNFPSAVCFFSSEN